MSWDLAVSCSFFCCYLLTPSPYPCGCFSHACSLFKMFTFKFVLNSSLTNISKLELLKKKVGEWVFQGGLKFDICVCVFFFVFFFVLFFLFFFFFVPPKHYLNSAIKTAKKKKKLGCIMQISWSACELFN